MADFDPTSLGAVAVEDAPFNPSSIGAVPVEEFSPESLGAVAVEEAPKELPYPSNLTPVTKQDISLPIDEGGILTDPTIELQASDWKGFQPPRERIGRITEYKEPLSEKIGRALSPLLGPTESQKIAESVPFGITDTGDTKYVYKPMASRLEQEGLAAPYLKVDKYAPKEGDTTLTQVGKATFNALAGLQEMLLNPLGVAMLPAAELAGVQAINKAIVGGFTAAGAAHLPEQLDTAFDQNKTTQERIEGGVGAALNLVLGAAGTKYILGSEVRPLKTEAEAAKVFEDRAAEIPIAQDPIAAQAFQDAFFNLPGEARDVLVRAQTKEQAGESLDRIESGVLSVYQRDVAGRIEDAQKAPISTDAERIAPEVEQTARQLAETGSPLTAETILKNHEQSIQESSSGPQRNAASTGTSGEPILREAGGTETRYETATDGGGGPSLQADQRVRESGEVTAAVDRLHEEGLTRTPEEAGPARVPEQPDAQGPQGEAIPATSEARDRTLVRAYDLANSIADRVAGGRDTVNGEAAFTAAFREAQAAIEAGKTPSQDIMRKAAMREAGKESTRSGTSLDAPIGEDGLTIADTLRDEGPLPDSLAEYADTVRNAEDMLKSLNERERDIISKKHGQDLTFAEIGEELGMTGENARRIYNQAKEKLAKRMAEQEFTAPEGYEGGPGAMGPVEGAAMEADRSAGATSTKNAVMREERAVRGEEPILAEARQTNEATLEQAEKTVEENPDAGRAIVERLKNSAESVRSISTADEAVLLVEKVRLRNLRNDEFARLTDEHATPEERLIAKQNYDLLEGQINDIDQATFASGAEWGRLGQFRQRLLREDFTLEAMERKARTEKGEPLTPEETAKIKEQSEKIQELQSKLETVEKTASEKAADEVSKQFFTELMKQAAKEEAATSKISPRVFALAESIITRLDSAADAARVRIRERLGKANAAVDPTVVYDVAVIGLSKLGHAALSFAKWSDAMVADLGDWVKPHLTDAWKQSEQMWKDEERKIGTDREPVKKVREKAAKTQDAKERLVNGINARAAEGDGLADVRWLVQKLALQLVKDGVKTRDALLSSVHDIVKQIYPELKPEQTRDLISGYGDFKPLSQEPAKVTLRDLKGQMQQISKIEAMQGGSAPKKTGVERRTPSDEERRLQKEVGELKRKGGFTVTDPATQLKTAQESIRTRLRNEIADLDNSIATKTPLVGKESSVSYDAGMKALKARRDELKAKYDETFPKKPLSPEEQIKRAGAALDRQIELLQSDLKSGKLYDDPSAPKPTSPQLQAKRAQLEALRAERENLRALDTERVESAREQALQDAIDNVNNTVQPREGQPTVDSKKVAALKQQLSDLREAKKTSPEAQAKKLEAAKEAVQKSIAEYDRKLREGDFAPKPTKPGVRDDALDTLRSERDSMEAAYREIVNSLKPKRSPEEIQLAGYKARTLSKIAELQDRMARGDFEPKPRTEVKLDAEALKIKQEAEKVREEFNESLLEYRRGQRNTAQKILGGVSETLNTTRAVLTSLDLSATLRQGGFIAFGNPVRAARAIPDMLRSFASKDAQFRSEQQLKARPNFDLYQKSKLFLSDVGSPKLSKMEEAYMSRWAKKIPLVAGSERAYTTFLNRLRADTFDALTATLGKDGGVSLDEAKVISNFVNVATGRGNLGKYETAGNALSTVFFSPRYVASRFQILAGSPLYGGNARTRVLIAKEYAKFLTGAAVVYGLLSMGSDQPIETDPTSSDFGKVRWGNTRIDPMGGLLQNTVLLSRMTESAVRSARGQTREYGEPSASEILARFARTKLAPIPGSALNIVEGTNAVGQQTTASGEAMNMAVPMSLKDVYNNMIEQGVSKGTAITMLSIFGLGIQTYKKSGLPMDFKSEAVESLLEQLPKLKEKHSEEKSGGPKMTPPERSRMARLDGANTRISSLRKKALAEKDQAKKQKLYLDIRSEAEKALK